MAYHCIHTDNNMNCIDRGAYSSIARSFWLLGLLNNAPWVLMLACATNISAGGVALVVSRCIKILIADLLMFF